MKKYVFLRAASGNPFFRSEVEGDVAQLPQEVAAPLLNAKVIAEMDKVQGTAADLNKDDDPKTDTEDKAASPKSEKATDPKAVKAEKATKK